MNLKQIVEQLESCNFECEAGPLENNVAFIELKRMAEFESKIEELAEQLAPYMKNATNSPIKPTFSNNFDAAIGSPSEITERVRKEMRMSW